MKNYYIVLAVAPLAMIASQSMAQVQQPVLASPQTAPASSDGPASAADKSPFMSMSELNEMRGGTQIAINNQTLNAENTGHNIDGDFTAGDVSLGNNALSDFNGLGNFVFNTGAQSSLQAGLSVTINISD